MDTKMESAIDSYEESYGGLMWAVSYLSFCACVAFSTGYFVEKVLLLGVPSQQVSDGVVWLFLVLVTSWVSVIGFMIAGAQKRLLWVEWEDVNAYIFSEGLFSLPLIFGVFYFAKIEYLLILVFGKMAIWLFFFLIGWFYESNASQVD